MQRKIIKGFCRGPGGGFFKRGWHPQPIEDGAEVAVKTSGKNKKFVFLANFYKVLVKRAPWPPEAKKVKKNTCLNFLFI
jgi:hypothetical protein